MPHVALLTLEDRGGYVIDDAIAVEALTRRGWRVDEVPWRRVGDARGYDAVVVRTTWDYQRDLDAFLAALGAVASAGVPLANDLSLIRWNARKTYLRDLAARGVVTVPTRWGEGLTPTSLRALRDAMPSPTFVVKPVVGANADDTYRIDATVDDASLAEIAARFVDRPFMAQPFVQSVLTDGELSLFYFGGRWSHAVVKVPRAGDFRVQEEHGGHIASATPPPDARAAADGVMASLDAPPLQARVDLVRLDDGAWALMELEAIEPSLYFRTHPDAADHFCDALEAWLPR